MSGESAVFEDFACPRCHGALDDVTEALLCSTCGTAYPIVSGVPCLLEDPALFRGLWKARLDDYLEVIAKRLAVLAQEADGPNLLAGTRARIRHVHDAVASDRRVLIELFSELVPNAGSAAPKLLPGADPRTGDTPVIEYSEHLFRDFVWGQAEAAVGALHRAARCARPARKNGGARRRHRTAGARRAARARRRTHVRLRHSSPAPPRHGAPAARRRARAPRVPARAALDERYGRSSSSEEPVRQAGEPRPRVRRRAPAAAPTRHSRHGDHPLVHRRRLRGCRRNGGRHQSRPAAGRRLAQLRAASFSGRPVTPLHHRRGARARRRRVVRARNALRRRRAVFSFAAQRNPSHRPRVRLCRQEDGRSSRRSRLLRCSHRGSRICACRSPSVPRSPDFSARPSSRSASCR